MVADLASRKKWPVPEYTIMADASSTGYSCTAVVNGRVFKTFKTHPSPAAAQEDVAGDIFKANSN